MCVIENKPCKHMSRVGCICNPVSTVYRLHHSVHLNGADGRSCDEDDDADRHLVPAFKLGESHLRRVTSGSNCQQPVTAGARHGPYQYSVIELVLEYILTHWND